MDIDIAAHGVDPAQSIETRFGAAQPQDTRQYPVSMGIALTKLRRIHFAGGPAGFENGIRGATKSDFSPYDVMAPGSALTVPLFTHPALGRGYATVENDVGLLIVSNQPLRTDVYFDMRNRHDSYLMTDANIFQ
jgi:hypothetical protein